MYVCELDKERDGVSLCKSHIETGTPSGGSGQICSAGPRPLKSHSRLEVLKEGGELEEGVHWNLQF